MKHKVEAFDIWQNMCQAIYEPLIRCRIDFEGHIDTGTLKQAVTSSIQAVPLIGCCFDDSQNRPRWVEKNFSGEDMVAVVEADDDANEQIARLFSSGIDFAKEPQLKIFLVRKNTGDTLCVIISHIVCDGMGFKEYLYVLSNLYTKLKHNESIAYPMLYARGIKPLFGKVTLKEKIRILLSRFDAYDPANQKEQQGVSFDETNREPRMETRNIPTVEFARLKIFAKSNNATVNDILMAMFARAFCKNSGTGKIMLPSTIDLRKFIPTGTNYGVSNYASNCMCHISVKSEDSLADTLRQVSNQMRTHKAGNSILKSVLLWDMAVRFLPYGFLKRNFTKIVPFPKISFSNLGVIDEALLCFDRAPIESAYLTASVKSDPYLQITASTCHGRCTLSCNFYGSNHDKEWVDRILDDIREETKALV